jgi:hypothetical protein
VVPVHLGAAPILSIVLPHVDSRVMASGRERGAKPLGVVT